MKYLLLFVSVFSFGYSNSQQVLSKIPGKGVTVNAFIPAGYDTIMTVEGDLNKDNIADRVLVLRSLVEDNEELLKSDDDTLPARIVVILFKTMDGYEVKGLSDKLILCKQCGGVMGDPFANAVIKRNVLTISHYGGSSYRWEYDHKFRYQDNDFYLIGKRSIGYSALENCEKLDAMAGTTLEDINYLTGDYIEKKVSEHGCKLLINKKGKKKTEPLIPLSAFSIEN